MELQKATVIFEISTLKFAKMPSFIHKQKTWNHGLKILHSGGFGDGIWRKTIAIFEVNTLIYFKGRKFRNKKISWKLEKIFGHWLLNKKRRN